MASIQAPVGIRWRTQNTANTAADQQTIIDLIWSLSPREGGKMSAHAAPPLAGPSGRCQPDLAEAIWDFQQFWKGKGVFRNIDGVVDPGGNTLKQLNALTRGGPHVRPDIQPPDPTENSSWRVTRISIAGGAMPGMGPVASNYAGIIEFYEEPKHGMPAVHGHRIRLSGSEHSHAPMMLPHAYHNMGFDYVQPNAVRMRTRLRHSDLLGGCVLLYEPSLGSWLLALGLPKPEGWERIRPNDYILGGNALATIREGNLNLPTHGHFVGDIS